MRSDRLRMRCVVRVTAPQRRVFSAKLVFSWLMGGAQGCGRVLDIARARDMTTREHHHYQSRPDRQWGEIASSLGGRRQADGENEDERTDEFDRELAIERSSNDRPGQPMSPACRVVRA